MTVAIVVGVVIAVLYYFRKNLASAFKAGTSVAANKGSAFARVAEQDGKLIALEAVTKVKKEAALAAHASLDEVDKLLG